MALPPLRNGDLLLKVSFNATQSGRQQRSCSPWRGGGTAAPLTDHGQAVHGHIDSQEAR